MSNREEQRLLKQKFLISQIIEQGYDATEFSEFLGKKKESGNRGLNRHRHRSMDL